MFWAYRSIRNVYWDPSDEGSDVELAQKNGKPLKTPFLVVSCLTSDRVEHFYDTVDMQRTLRFIRKIRNL